MRTYGKASPFNMSGAASRHGTFIDEASLAENARLCCNPCRESPERSSFSRIGPDRQTVPEPLGKRQLVIRKFAPSYARPPSRAAESAAAVACFGVLPSAL